MIVLINEENRKLKNRMFPIPKGVMKHLRKVLSEYEKKDGDKNNKGYDHLKWIVGQDRVSTEELKRTKNFFDNYNGTKESDDYKLYGGKEMSDWINAVLNQATKSIESDKKANKDAGLGNTERKTHDKKPRVHVGEPTTASKNCKTLSIALNENKIQILEV